MIIIGPLIDVTIRVLDLYLIVIIASVILSWLVAFQVVNMYNRFVNTVGQVLSRLTEPALRPIRRVLPNLGGIDLSPLVLIFAIYFLQEVLIRLKFALGG